MAGSPWNKGGKAAEDAKAAKAAEAKPEAVAARYKNGDERRAALELAILEGTPESAALGRLMAAGFDELVEDWFRAEGKIPGNTPVATIAGLVDGCAATIAAIAAAQSIPGTEPLLFAGIERRFADQINRQLAVHLEDRNGGGS